MSRIAFCLKDQEGNYAGKNSINPEENQSQITKKIGLVEVIIEPRIKNWFELETSSEHKKSELIRMSEDEVDQTTAFLITFSSIRKIKFESRRMGVDVTTSDGHSYTIGCKLIRDEIERKRIADLFNTKSNQLSKDELLELFNVIEDELVCVNFNEREDAPYTTPPVILDSLNGFMDCEDNHYYFDTSMEDYNYSINFDAIETIYYSPVIPGIGGCQIEIGFITGDCLNIEQLSGY